MWGSTASKRWGAARAQASGTKSRAALVLVMLDAVIPEAVHLVRGGNFGGAHQAEAEPLRIGEVPDALGQLRVLLLPIGVGPDACGAGDGGSRVVPGAAANGMRVGRFRRRPL